MTEEENRLKVDHQVIKNVHVSSFLKTAAIYCYMTLSSIFAVVILLYIYEHADTKTEYLLECDQKCATICSNIIEKRLEQYENKMNNRLLQLEEKLNTTPEMHDLYLNSILGLTSNTDEILDKINKKQDFKSGQLLNTLLNSMSQNVLEIDTKTDNDDSVYSKKLLYLKSKSAQNAPSERLVSNFVKEKMSNEFPTMNKRNTTSIKYNRDTTRKSLRNNPVNKFVEHSTKKADATKLEHMKKDQNARSLNVGKARIKRSDPHLAIVQETALNSGHNLEQALSTLESIANSSKGIHPVSIKQVGIHELNDVKGSILKLKNNVTKLEERVRNRDQSFTDLEHKDSALKQEINQVNMVVNSLSVTLHHIFKIQKNHSERLEKLEDLLENSNENHENHFFRITKMEENLDNVSNRFANMSGILEEMNDLTQHHHESINSLSISHLKLQSIPQKQKHIEDFINNLTSTVNSISDNNGKEIEKLQMDISANTRLLVHILKLSSKRIKRLNNTIKLLANETIPQKLESYTRDFEKQLQQNTDTFQNTTNQVRDLQTQIETLANITRENEERTTANQEFLKNLTINNQEMGQDQELMFLPVKGKHNIATAVRNSTINGSASGIGGGSGIMPVGLPGGSQWKQALTKIQNNNNKIQGNIKSLNNRLTSQMNRIRSVIRRSAKRSEKGTTVLQNNTMNSAVHVHFSRKFNKVPFVYVSLGGFAEDPKSSGKHALQIQSVDHIDRFGFVIHTSDGAQYGYAHYQWVKLEWIATGY